MSSVHIENKSLSEYCSEVFGSVFKKAYLEVFVYKETELESQIANEKNLDFSDGQYDTRTIVIEFTNGNVVKFTNSEWASFESTKLEHLNISECGVVEYGK